MKPLFLLLSLISLTACNSDEKATPDASGKSSPTSPSHIGTSDNYLAGIDLEKLPYIPIAFGGLNGAGLDNEKLDSIIRSYAKGRGITLVDQSDQAPNFSFMVKTVGNAQQGFAFVIQASIIEEIVVSRNEKKFSGGARTWQRDVLGHFPFASVTEEQVAEGIAMMLDLFVKGVKTAKLPEE